MNVLENNCVSTIEVPSNVESAEGFDYNPVLNLYATFNYKNGLSVWVPRSGKVVAQVKHLEQRYQAHLSTSATQGHFKRYYLCCCNVGKTIHTDYQVKLNSLPISYMLKNYLLYK